MRIALNTRFGSYPYAEGYGRFVREISAGLLGQSSPEDRFLFLYDQPGEQLPGDAARVTHRLLGPPAKHPLLWRLWYDIQVPRVLRGFRADVFLSPDGICSLTTRVPQVVVIHDLAFLHFPGSLPAVQQRYYARLTPKFIRKAAVVVTVSEHAREDILAHYPQARGKVQVVPNAADPAYQPLSWQEKDRVRDQYTDGREYFLYTGSIHPRKNLINLLKAFSIFKKRQRTGMKLVLAGRLAWQHEAFTDALARYKFRDDVILTGYVPADAHRELVAAAYALVYPSLWEGFGIPLLEAMQSGVPVLCSQSGALPETAADAGLYFDPTQPEDIARQLSRMYIDETERARLIERGRERAQMFSWQRSAEKMREILYTAAGRPTIPTFAS